MLSLHRVTTQHATIQVPVFDALGEHPGHTLLVTAGMDGDEFAGIAAAYELIRMFSSRHFRGRLIIVPIVNTPGFLLQTSRNPLDGMFPKYLYPGRADGTPSERLIHWITTRYVREADCWVDLHSGSLTEHLRPFVWTQETDDSHLNARLVNFLRCHPSDTLVYEKKHRGSRMFRVGNGNTAYFLCESGERGETHASQIRTHVSWVCSAMRVFSLLSDTPVFSPRLSVFRRVSLTVSPRTGLWVPRVLFPQQVASRFVLGEVQSFDMKHRSIVRAKQTGRILWQKFGLSCMKHETLGAIGSQMETFSYDSSRPAVFFFS